MGPLREPPSAHAKSQIHVLMSAQKRSPPQWDTGSGLNRLLAVIVVVSHCQRAENDHFQDHLFVRISPKT